MVSSGIDRAARLEDFDNLRFVFKNVVKITAMLTVAQPSLTSAPPSRAPRSRRFLVLESGDGGVLLKRIATARRSDIEIARVVSLRGNEAANDLASALNPHLLRTGGISAVLISRAAALQLPAELLLQCRLDGIRVMGEANFWEDEANQIDIECRDLGWFLGGRGFRSSRYVNMRARCFDLIIATALLLFTLPVMLIVALLIKMDSRGPVLYRQERVGRGGRTFTLYKFRSMTDDAEGEGRPCWAAIEDPRITRVGKIIRYARIDEFPQLLNVLRGEMSMIGPRPERPYFVEQLSLALPFYGARHSVKPGITGWAQVNAPYGASIEESREKLRYDLYYVKHRTFYLDLLILFRTIRVVICGEGAR